MGLDLSRDDAVETAIALGIFGGTLVVVAVLAVVLPRIIHRLTHATESQLDDLILHAVRSPLLATLLVAGGYAALRSLSYLDEHSSALARAAAALTLAIVVLVVQRVASALINWYGQAIAHRTETDWDEKSLPLVRRLANVLIVVVGALVVLGQLGVSISPLLAGLGIGGLAVALALQPLLSNIFASSYMLSDASIRVGDYIAIEGGVSGVVADVGFRATRVRTFDNNVVLVPNATLAESVVTNYDNAEAAADARVTCGVAYEEDLERVEQICMEELVRIRDEFDQALDGREPLFRWQSFGDSNVDFLMKLRANSWTDSFFLSHVIVKRIHGRLAREGVTINYPARRLFLEPEDTAGLQRLAPPAVAQGPGADGPRG